MTTKILQKLRNIYYIVHNRYSTITLIALLLCVVVLLYPYQVVVYGIPLVTWYVKQRIVAVAILYLILAGIMDWRASSWLPILFLVSLVLASSFQFAYIIFFTLAAMLVLKSLRKL
ncbi:MAG: hypothetical protein WCO78_03985 [Candidatus Roizmanbacteria bacterium]